MLPQTTQLPNGIRIIYQYAGKSRVTHMSLLIHAGTRHEKKGKEGLAHFIEHVFFKGTRKRKSYHILNRLDSVGGELNAFTSKEETCLYASVMNQHAGRAIELLSDIFFNSVFPARELEKEKLVIYDEIRSYADNPSEQIQDDFETQVFASHALGNPVLGTMESIRQIEKKDIVDFMQENYKPGKIVFSVVSELPWEELKALCMDYFGGMVKHVPSRSNGSFKHYQPAHKTVFKQVTQSHVVLGNVAYSYRDDDRYALALLTNILGGPGMNSRLNLHIREKYGYTYQIDASYMPYSDTGLFTIYFATDQKNVEKTNHLVLKELALLRREKIKEAQLKRYQEQFVGQLAMSYENKAGLALSAAKSLLCFNRIDSHESVKRRIESVTSSGLLRVANEILDTNYLSSLQFHPAKP